MEPVTPMRQIPGAYINTPAPNTTRRQLFNNNAGIGVPPPMGLQPTNSVGPGPQAPATGQLPPQPAVRADVPPIETAAAVVNATLLNDESYPDLDSYCRPGASSEYDMQQADTSWAPFQKTHMYQIPDQIFEFLNGGEVFTKLGLFPELGYAWASIDSSLFLWDYTHPTPELIGYEELTHTITAVALVAPKPGVFVKTITHILVISTTTDIILVGVAAETNASGGKKVTLYQTKMAVHRGGSDVSYIVGTANGRIFVGGETDTDIHEIIYQQEERWFSSRCSKVNHTHTGWSSVVPLTNLPFGPRPHEHLVGLYVDDTRNLVYSLSDRSTIRTYHMEGPEKLTKVIEKDKTSCLRDFAHLAAPSPLFTDQTTIVSLSPISATETSKLHLMALTDTGCRLFLSATSAASYTIGGGPSTLPPQSMQLQFIKFPPKDAFQRTRDVNLQPIETILDKTSRLLETSAMGVRFPPGYFFDIVRKGGGASDMLFISTPDTGRIKITQPTSVLKYAEQATFIDLGAGNRTIEIGSTTKPFSANGQPLGFGNELAVQFDHAPGEFAILTNTGVHIIRRRRMVDMLAAALRSVIGQGDEALEREIRKFLVQYGRVETCSAALAVACGQGSDSRTGIGRSSDTALANLARLVFVEYGGQARVAESDGHQSPQDSVRLSSRHDALAVYFARLVRALWKTKVVTISSAGNAVTSTVPMAKLAQVQEQVDRLENFLESNKGTIQGLSGPPGTLTNRNEEIAAQKEHQAFHGMRQLMKSVAEGISFVTMLFDERVADIYARLEPADQEKLQSLTYENLFSQKPGKELAKVLVKAIVNRNIASGANVDTVADALRRRCGSFCSPDDVIIFKAQEQLQRASEQVNNVNTARMLLGESLKLFQEVASSLSATNLEKAVDQYINLKYYAGAIQLCLVVAREKDRGNTALTWVNDGRPTGDSREATYHARKNCYLLIQKVLDRLETDLAAEPDTIDGRQTWAATKRKEAYDVVNNSDDEVFHFDLYDWYISKNWIDRLLAIDSPHVQTYLQRLAETNYQHAELLCRYYTHRNYFFQAAQVQATLAKSDMKIGIKDRIKLLGLAKANASVNTAGVSRQQQQMLNHEVTELLEIAHIQDDLLQRLLVDRRIDNARKMEVDNHLNGPILSVNELYNMYADQAGYFDLCLLIYHAADFQNPRVIAETWDNLIHQVHNETEVKAEIWKVANTPGQQVPPELQGDIPEVEPPLPYECVIQQVQLIAHRASLDSLVFPVDKLIPMICAYAIEYNQDASIGADPNWPVWLFLHLGVPHALVVQVLEGVFDGQEVPFVGRRRKNVAGWIVTVVEDWVREVERRGRSLGTAGDTGGVGVWVGELLGRVDGLLRQFQAGGVRSQLEKEELDNIRGRLAATKRSIEGLLAAAQVGGGSVMGGFSFRGGLV
ncbi:Non-repetitive/WGA-negative nucleoporin C-terminal-domain-containing protein [Apiosordaria backusii]|uniref:Non-repetitive/WGA-negative nucleoporin C-terminal-domain-containing protein n=1 Tax=Apiosordaria backusii TaxID=314023 RepID=A0AA40E8J3_9PEZI|nr:Non-repetitive/WGA-negative nucleoporin C-terminal-domain-containing protein [Apiosordaria backusii]